MSEPTLADRARVAIRGEWMPGMRVFHDSALFGPGHPGRIDDDVDASMRRFGYVATLPDLADPPTVFALATIARKRLDACDADHGVTTARRDKLGQALAQWADGSLTLAGLAEALVEVLETIKQGPKS